MQKAVNDVNTTLEQFEGQVNYESIMSMKFIDLCVKETLRKYPGLPILNRECTKDYELPGTTVKIAKGTSVIISLLGIHRDEKFFPNPDKYYPDRFTEEIHDYDEDMYMPFGAGPRNCIGELHKSSFLEIIDKDSVSLSFQNGTVSIQSCACDASEELQLRSDQQEGT
jgi:cytochrome P450 family 6